LTDLLPAQRRRPPTDEPRRPRHALPEPEPEDDPDDPEDDGLWAGSPVSARAVVPMPPGSDRAVLMPPPSDDEKLLYRNRRLAVLTGASLISFGTLMVSQVMFLRMSPWLLLFVPAFVFTVAYYLISLGVNAGT